MFCFLHINYFAMILNSETVFNYLLFSYSQKRLAKEARTQEIQAKNAALGKKIKDPTSAKGIKGRGEASFYRVACKVKFLLVEIFFDATRCVAFFSWLQFAIQIINFSK